MKVEDLHQVANNLGINHTELSPSVLRSSIRSKLKDLEPTHSIVQRQTDLITGEVRYILVETFNNDFQESVEDVLILACKHCRR